MKPSIQALDHLVLTVQSIKNSVAFYVDILGMTVEHFQVADGNTRTALKFGSQKINLHQSGVEFLPHAARPTAGSADLCFLSHMPLLDWIGHLEKNGVEVEAGPVPRTGATGPLRSIYFRDPDGNLIEVSNPA